MLIREDATTSDALQAEDATRHNNPARRRTIRDSIALRIPGVGPVARRIARIASRRIGRVPVGLILLLPVALLLDLFDAADEAFFGPVGMVLAFGLETAFLLGVTGRASWSLGGAFFDLIPGVDVVPIATLTLLARIVEEWRAGEGADEGRHRPQGPVIDV